MPYCASCGAEVTGRFCGKCGAAAGEATGGGGAGAAAAPAASATAGGLSDNAAAALSYVLFLGILFLLIDPYKTRKPVRFHAFQAIFLGVASLVFWIAYDIVAGIMGHISAVLAILMGLVGMLIALAFLGVWIYCIFQAYQGKQTKLPIIGSLAEQQA